MESQQDSVLGLLAKPVQEAARRLGVVPLTEVQVKAIPPILAGRNILLVAPTGSGKTEAVLLPLLSNLLGLRGELGVLILYVTPLRALNRDLLKRLMFWEKELGVRVAVRHGDTLPSERRRQSLKPPSLLLTTPETLQAILPGTRMRRHLRSVRWVIVDEIHELAEDKRGVQLMVALERLREVTGRDFQRVGISATIGDVEKVARFLGGADREVDVIQVQLPKGFEYSVDWPLPTEEDRELSQTLYTTPEATARITRIRDLVESHGPALVFVNSRTNAEMLGLRFKMLYSTIGVHHGSLAREERKRVEDDFKEGKLDAIICTSTLELGIDIGSVSLVLQYLSPRHVRTLIQRVGRSGHKLGLTSKGVIIVCSPDDCLEAIATVRRAKSGLLEPVKIHANALDVLAHQVAGLVLDLGGVQLSAVNQIIRRADPYKDLDHVSLRRVVDYLVKLGEIRLSDGVLRGTGKTREYYYNNLSMIPDERRYPIIDLSTDQEVGILGEEFIMMRARVGLHFICKGLVWKIERLGDDGRVYVSPVEDPTAAIPGWDGEMLPVPYDLAMEVGRLRRVIAEAYENTEYETAVEHLSKTLRAQRYAVKKVVDDVRSILSRGVSVPSDNSILVEGYDHYVVIHACFGDAVNRTLGYIFDHMLSNDGLIRNCWSDGYRVLIELTVEVDEAELHNLAKRILQISPQDAEAAFQAYLTDRFPFSYYAKFVAERFGAIVRGLSLGADRLTELVQRFATTPIYDETLREALLEKADLHRVKEILRMVQEGAITVNTILSSEVPTPLAYRILNRFAEVPEMMALELAGKDAVERMRNAILGSHVELFCLGCGRWEAKLQVKNLPEQPRCQECGSPLLAALTRSNLYAKECVRKRLRGLSLSEDEQRALSKTRQNADLVLSYGRRAVMALLVFGVGPQTASRILAKMHYQEEDFFTDLLKAKLQYVQTRPYWSDG